MKIFIAIILIFSASTAYAVDACDSQIPSSLKIGLAKTFPNFRVLVATDNSPEDIEWNEKEGGKGCFGVAGADFDGDGVKDYILGLTARKGTGAAVVVASARVHSWSFQTLGKWNEGRNRLYVAVDKPGIYKRTEALAGPLEPDEIDPLKCPHSVVIFGTIESSGVAYCYIKGSWKHVWISD